MIFLGSLRIRLECFEEEFLAGNKHVIFFYLLKGKEIKAKTNNQ